MQLTISNWATQVEACEERIKNLGLRRDDDAVAERREVTRILGGAPSQGVDHKRRTKILLEIARQIDRIGHRVLGAIEPAAFAVFAARESQDPALLREALTMQSAIFIALENIQDAAVCLEEAWSIAETLPPDDFTSKFAVLLNIGASLYQGFMHADASVAYRKAEATAVAAGNNSWRGMALSNLALCALETHQYEDGLVAIREAINLMATPRTPDDFITRVFAEGHFVRLLLQLGRLPEAKERVIFAKKYAEQSGSVRAEISAAGVDGLCSIYGGSLDVGRTLVLKALDTARTVPSSLRSALLTTVQALEATGDPAEALAYHREFSLIVKRHLRDNILQYTKHQVIAVSEHSLDLANQMSDEKSDALRQTYIASASNIGTQAFLQSQAMSAEMEWDPDGVHIYRVGELAKRLGMALGLDESTCRSLELGARLHDLGMKTVPRSLKMKAESLTNVEAAEVRKHTVDGAELISHSNVPYVAIAEDIVRHHHENWDGTGYPDGLREAGIPLAARIASLADGFDSMTHPRRFRNAKTFEEAITEISRGLGKQYDPQAGAVFVNMLCDLKKEHSDLDAVLETAAKATALSRTRAKLRSTDK